MKPVFISLFPNLERDDFFLTLKLLFQPWKWLGEPHFLEEEFKKYFNVRYAISFNSGRSALMAILASLGLERGDEVLIQAFTCNALVNPILWTGLKPIFVDCDKKTLNIDPKDLTRKISQKSRVLIVQHTFGLPADLDTILEICKSKKLILIEDCAHSLGATFRGKKIGTFGKAAFFSFGRDKIISSIFGGLAITNDKELGKAIYQFWQKCKKPSLFWIFQQLLSQVLVGGLVKPLYDFFEIGKIFLFLLQKSKIVSKAVTKKEKEGKNPDIFPRKMPKALAALAEKQFKKLEKLNCHRERIAQIYKKELKELASFFSKDIQGRIWMRYPLVFDKEAQSILNYLERKKIFLDDGWRGKPIVPPDTNQKRMGYNLGSCPQAEIISKNILNLPTHIGISGDQAKIISKLIKDYLNENRKN